MRSSFDRRVVPEGVLALIRSCQGRVPCELGGGAALSGVYLAHRLSNDIDLFCARREDVRRLVQALPEIASETGTTLEIIRDEGSFARAHCMGRVTHPRTTCRLLCKKTEEWIRASSRG
jgi:hypothetical protein